MKTFFVVFISLIGIVFQWRGYALLNNLARTYEHLFLIENYEYAGLFDPSYWKELSYGEKIFCSEEYATESMKAVLRNIEDLKMNRLPANYRRVVGDFFVDGNHFVIKQGEKVGFMGNLLRRGMGVEIWNNAHWMKKKGIPALKSVALVEKRSWNRSKSFVVYLYEGNTCQNVLKEREDFFPKLQQLEELLYRNCVIHQDFHFRNVLILEGDELQLIDIDKVHYYPRNSFVFRERMKREVRKFNRHLEEQTSTQKRIILK